MKKYVLDANAVLDLLAGRVGGKRVANLFREAERNHQPLLMSVINWGEVLSQVWKDRGEEEVLSVAAALATLPLTIRDVTRDDAMGAVRLKCTHKLPYADSFAAALAIRERAVLVTGDPHFKRVGQRLSVLWLR